MALTLKEFLKSPKNEDRVSSYSLLWFNKDGETECKTVTRSQAFSLKNLLEREVMETNYEKDDNTLEV